MADINDFMKFIRDNMEDEDLPEDVKGALSNKKAARQMIQQDLESEYATLQAGLMEQRIANDKIEIECGTSRFKFRKQMFDLGNFALLIGVLAGSYMTVLACIWLTKHL